MSSLAINSSVSKSGSFDDDEKNSPRDSPQIPALTTGAPAPPRRSTFQQWIPSLLRRKTAASRRSTTEVERKVADKLTALASLSADKALLALGSHSSGLDVDEVLQMRSLHGQNVLSSSAPPSNLRLLVTAFNNPFNYLLVTLAIISIATGDYPTFTVMMLMVFISTLLRFWQERKSTKKAKSLSDRLTSKVLVHRHVGSRVDVASDGRVEAIEINRDDLVVGDIVRLQSGDLVPADCVLIEAHALMVSTAVLTGEAFPLSKTLDTTEDKNEGVIHVSNILLSGTSISSGEGRAVVALVGDQTYVAAITSLLGATRPVNIFQKQVRAVSYLLLLFMAVMVPIVFLIQGFVNKQDGWLKAFIFSIAVAVGLTPEMLPLIVNANLARGAIQMGKKNVIVKRLDAVQVLGSMNCLCSDKTGTLTIDDVELYAACDGFGAPSQTPLALAYVNSHLQTGTRSLLDAAITSAQAAAEFAAHSKPLVKLGEVPFDSARRLLSVYVSLPGVPDALVITKGAVEEVLQLCTSYSFENSASFSSAHDLFTSSSISTPLDAAAREKILQTATDYNQDGLRLVAVARRIVAAHGSRAPRFTKDDEHSLCFVGFLAFLDPPKLDAAEAIADLKTLGVAVKILTGDAPTIAVKVARDLRLLPLDSASTDVITGQQLAVLSAGDRSQFCAAVKRITIFSKLSPFQKLEVVEALREQGLVVGMLGDGVNDALALRGADVGISVDTATAIAQDASDIILLEKNLGQIVEGIRLGRVTLINTVKYLKLASSSNFGNVFSILAASAWLPYQPMQPLQILIQNLLYDMSQAAIPWDNVDADYLVRPVSFDIVSVARFMIVFGPLSSIFDIATFSINYYKYGINTFDSPLIPVAQSTWFCEGFMTQLLVVYFLRTGKIPFIQSSPSFPLLLSTLSFLGIAMAVPYIPGLNTAFGFAPLYSSFYGFLVAIVVCYCILVQTAKTIYLKFYPNWF